VEVDRSHAEVPVYELVLEDVQRYAFAGELDRMRVAQRVRHEAAAHAERAAKRPNVARAADGAPASAALSTASSVENVVALANDQHVCVDDAGIREQV
jgi:hypothetical protein